MKTYLVEFESHDAMTSNLATLRVHYSQKGDKKATVRLTNKQLDRLCQMDGVKSWSVLTK